MLTNVCQYEVLVGPRTDYATKGVPSRAYLSEWPRVIYYPHYAHTGDSTRVSQLFIKSSGARVNVDLS
jgi:hypothetical protein